AEETGHVAPRRRERVIERRWNQHLDDRASRPSLRARVEIGLLHVLQRRRNDNASGVMRRALSAWQAGEIRKLGQRNVHAERARGASPTSDVLAECRW